MPTIKLPASKSISHRALLIQALSNEPMHLENISDAHDTRILKKLLNELPTASELHTEDAGTVFRFLLSFLAIQKGRMIQLKGSARMHQRPIADLVDALRSLGADIVFLENEGYPPLRIHGKALHGGDVHISANVSSQFISALCLIAPLLPQELRIHIEGMPVSKPYILMTLSVMRDFGVTAVYAQNQICIQPARYRTTTFHVESDWSSASFFYAAVLLQNDLHIFLENLYEKSYQGDAFISTLCRPFGVESMFTTEGLSIHYIEPKEQIPTSLDVRDYPDMIIPLLVVFAVRFPQVRLTGIHHLSFKESDRLAALQTELRKIGCRMHYDTESIWFDPAELIPMQDISFQSYHDHRIVMALNNLQLLGYRLCFDDTDCVRKSFPDYWTQFNRLIS